MAKGGDWESNFGGKGMDRKNKLYKAITSVGAYARDEL